MGSNIKEAIKLINDAEPTAAQMDRILAIAHQLDIPANDAMFPILVMLDTYHWKISETKKAVNASLNVSKGEWVKACADAAVSVANNTTIKHKWQWATGGMSVAFLVIGLAVGIGYMAGKSKACGSGHVAVKEEKTAVSQGKYTTKTKRL